MLPHEKQMSHLLLVAAHSEQLTASIGCLSFLFDGMLHSFLVLGPADHHDIVHALVNDRSARIACACLMKYYAMIPLTEHWDGSILPPSAAVTAGDTGILTVVMGVNFVWQ